MAIVGKCEDLMRRIIKTTYRSIAIGAWTILIDLVSEVKYYIKVFISKMFVRIEISPLIITATHGSNLQLCDIISRKCLRAPDRGFDTLCLKLIVCLLYTSDAADE